MRTPYLWSKTFWSLVLVLILYSTSYCFYDRPIDLWMHHHVLSTHPLTHISNEIARIFAPKHWAILALCLTIIGALFKSKRVLYWGVAVLASTVICFVLKTLLARYRPDLLFSQNLYGFHFFSLKHDMNSTPSGHAVAAFTGFYAFARLYKSWTLSFILILCAILIGISRVVVTAHYPSDILLGAYIGIFTTLWTEALFFKKNKTKK